MSARTIFLMIFLACTAMLAVAGYFQFVKGLEPCPLCIFQRVGIIIVGVVALIAAVHGPRAVGVRIYSALGAITAILGGFISARHVWVQNLPADQVPECGPDLSFMLSSFPFMQMLETVLKGSGECADILLKFMGLTIPAWTLIAFSVMALLFIWQMFRRQAYGDLQLNIAPF